MQRTGSLENTLMLGRTEGRKGMTEDEMVGWHHRLNGHEFEQALRVGEGQGSVACSQPWRHKELDMTERLNWTENFPPTQRLVVITSTVLHMLATGTRLQAGWNQRLMIPEISRCCLTINQSGENSGAATLTQNVVFQNTFLKAIREFGSLEHEPPIFLAWHCAKPQTLSFPHHNLVSVVRLCCASGVWTKGQCGSKDYI